LAPAKGLAFQDGYPSAWQRMAAEHPDVAYGSSNLYQSWEVVDPEKWVPHGYACVRVDSRGAGRSPGIIDHFSPRETKDLYHCIEWAAVQPWSSGKVGLNGISYYAMNQWHVATLQPSHLAAMCIGRLRRLVSRPDSGGIFSSLQRAVPAGERSARPRRARPRSRATRRSSRRRDPRAELAKNRPTSVTRFSPTPWPTSTTATVRPSGKRW
jgi:predicted acyl esterase